MPFPLIDPVAFHLGPLPVRWYGLAYMAGIVLGLLLARRYARRYREFGLTPELVEGFSFWVTVGILVGGRIGYIALYHPATYWADPAAMLRLYEGGMSFHGGLAGVVLAALLFCRHHRVPLLRLTDPIACVVPIGLGLGRLANFINGELWGRATDVPWAMVFPTGGSIARHPSQLYEAALEGVLIFLLLNTLVRFKAVRLAHGLLTGMFAVAYGIIRVSVELVREPDASLLLGLTRGQVFSIPMVVGGVILVAHGLRQRRQMENQAGAAL